MRSNLHIVYKVDNTCKRVDGCRFRSFSSVDGELPFDVMVGYDDGWFELAECDDLIYENEKEMSPYGNGLNDDEI